MEKVDKNAKNGQFWKTENRGQIVLPDRSLLIRQKLPKNAKLRKWKMRHFKEFSNTVHTQKVSVIPTFASFFIFHNFFFLIRMHHGCVQWQGKLTCLQAFKMLQWLSKMWKLFLNRKATLISYLEFHYCINKCHQQSTYFIVKWNTKSKNCKLRCHLDENCTKAQKI